MRCMKETFHGRPERMSEMVTPQNALWNSLGFPLTRSLCWMSLGDGKYILVGNYLSQDFSILKVNGTSVTDTGKRFQVPGHPASARMGP